MKKLFTTLAIAAACVGTASAQRSADFSMTLTGISDTIIDCDDEIIFQYKIKNNGPTALGAGDTLFIGGPWNEVGYGSLFPLTGPFNVGDSAILQDTLRADEILNLIDLDIEDFVGPDDYEFGKRYIMYFYGFTIDRFNWTDPVEDNNFAGVWVTWNCPTSIFTPGLAKNNINVYPNPATSAINFNYNFDKVSNVATARVIDITGRVVLTQEFGRQAAGNQLFNVNAANLPNGLYTLEFVTDDNRGVSKFTIAK